MYARNGPRRASRDARRRRRRAGLTVALAAVVVLAGAALAIARPWHSAAASRALGGDGRRSTPRSETAGSSKPRASSTTTATGPRRPPYPVGSARLVISDDHTDDTLPTVVYYPATHAGAGAPADHAGGPYPLLVFSQGFDYAVSGYAYLLEHWAAAGFVVAAPTYPHTAPGSVLDEGDILNHPADLATVVHTLLSGPGTPAVLSGLVERSEVGLVGQSDGGDVTLAAADNTCCRVAGVKAAAILSGAELDSFGGSYFPSPSVPLLVVQGSADPINPPGCSAQLYDASPQPKHYLDLLGATHIAPYTEPGEDLSIVTAVTTDFFRATLDGNRSALRAAQAAGNVADVAELSSAPDAPQPLGPCPGAP